MASNPLSLQIWNRATLAIREYPLFGLGMGSFRQISDERLARWTSERSESFDPSRYLGSSHAHNLYLNTLAERGVVGSLPVAVFLAWWFWMVIRRRPKADADPWDAVAWTSAAGAIFVVLIAGLVNTTLHHEHGSLALLFLGLWLSRIAPE